MFVFWSTQQASSEESDVDQRDGMAEALCSSLPNGTTVWRSKGMEPPLSLLKFAFSTLTLHNKWLVKCTIFDVLNYRYEVLSGL